MLTAQSGVEVSLGLLPFLPLYAPGQALEASPELVVVNTALQTTAYRISEISFQPPTRLTLTALSGTRIVLVGAAVGHVHPLNGPNATFCTACSTVQLKSAITGEPGIRSSLG